MKSDDSPYDKLAAPKEVWGNKLQKGEMHTYQPIDLSFYEKRARELRRATLAQYWHSTFRWLEKFILRAVKKRTPK